MGNLTVVISGGEAKLQDHIEGENIGEKTHQLLQYREKRINELDHLVYRWEEYRKKLLRGDSIERLEKYYHIMLNKPTRGKYLGIIYLTSQNKL